MASTLKIIFVIGGIFVAGAVTGGFVSLRVADHLAREKRITPRIASSELGERLARQLELTPEQRERTGPIIRRTAEELRKMRRETFGRATALIAEMDVELAKELTDAQRERLKAVRAKEAERRKRWLAERAERDRENDSPTGATSAER